MKNTKLQIKVAVVSLGCDKNRVDSEKMLFRLVDGGLEISNQEQAQVIIVNTCAFIESARREAIETILSCAKLKQGNCKKLIVTGCLPQKYLLQLKADLPEVDAFLGIDQYDKILGLIADVEQSECFSEELRLLTTTPTYAYLKIADGCNNRCSYCTIPSIRGAYRSYKIESLVSETVGLAQNGVKEIILVAQDVTNYGIDLYKKRSLVELIRALSLTEIECIRLMYCYPERIDEQLIQEITNNPKVVKYLDIPLQHINDRVLGLMNRRGTSQQIKNLIDKLKSKIPSIAIRTTFISGFPSETQEEHEQLKNFILDYKLNHVGVFAYSLEKDTQSAKIMPRVPKSIANKRKKELMLAQQQVVAQINSSYVNKVFKVLYEGIDYNKSLFFGRAYFNAPDVDSIIYFTADYAEFGQFYNVEITSVLGYDLYGRVID